MKKLYRSTLVAVVLAFGVVACGDDVQIVEPEPTPPPALQVTLTPQNVNLTVGDNINLAVGISGGQAGAAVNITCESSNTDVVTTTVSGNNCAVTAEGPGNATVTATVQKGNQESSAGAAISVGAVQEASVTISQINQGGLPADINDISGQLDVVLNVNPGDEIPQRVDLFVDETIVASQVFTQAQVAEMQEMVEEAETAEEQVQQITLSFNTARYDVNEDEGTASIWHLNGEKEISAELRVVQAPGDPRASNTVLVQFNNVDGYHVLGQRPNNSALDDNGRRWFGGPDTHTDITAIEVFYSGQTAAQVTVSFCGIPLASDEVAHSFEFPCEDFEGTTGVAVSGQYAEDGDDTPTTILNEDNPVASVRIDNVAPQADVDEAEQALPVFSIVRQAGLDNVGNWLNDQYSFANGLRFGNVVDGGVGKVAEAEVGYQIRTGTDELIAPTPSLTGADLAAELGEDAESVTNTEYNARAQLCDRLGNCRFFGQEPDDENLHPASTFGYDETAPTLTLLTDEMGAFEESDAIVNVFEAGDDIRLDGTDTASGFAPIGAGFAFSRALVAVGSTFDEPENPALTALVGVLGDTPTTTPFGTLDEGGSVATLQSIAALEERDGEAFDLAVQTRIEYTWTLGDFIESVQEDIEDASYWIYQVRIRDQAGNTNSADRTVLHNRGASPDLEAITRSAGFPADPAFTATFATDELELFEASIALDYPEHLGQLVWERPSAEVSSVLRASADIEDGIPFTDFIKRPHRNLGLALDFDALGLPFLKNVQELGSTPDNTKPNRAEAQVYNGWTLEATDIIHGAPAAIGQSTLTDVGIPAEEVADHTVDFTDDTDITSFEVVDSSVENCDTYCARLFGPPSTFELPVLRDGVLIVWRDADAAEMTWRVLTVAEPNFSGQFPTRDDGDERLFEWTFDGTVEGFEGNIEFRALALNSSGDGLLSGGIDQDLPDPDPEADQLNVVSGDGQELNEGETSNPLIVQLLDDQGDPMAGETINFSGSGADHTLSSSSAVTDANGRASITVTALAEGAITVTASFGTLEAEFNLTVGPVPDETNSQVTITPAGPLLANGSDEYEIVVELFDGTNTAITTERNVVIESDLGTVSAVDWAGGTNTYTATLTSTEADTATVTVTADGVHLDTQTRVFDPSSAALVQVDGDGQLISAGSESEPLVVRLDDQFGDPMVDETVTFTSVGPDHTLSSTSVQTDGNGEASITVTAGQEDGDVVVQASADGVSPVDFTVTISDISETDSTVDADPGSVPADDATTSTITVTLVNLDGVTITDERDVVIESNLGTVSAVTWDGTANTYTATITSDATGTATITATADGFELEDTATVIFTTP